MNHELLKVRADALLWRESDGDVLAARPPGGPP
jgi:hypothetical protein